MITADKQYAVSYWFLCVTTVTASVLLIYQCLLCSAFRYVQTEFLRSSFIEL